MSERERRERENCGACREQLAHSEREWENHPMRGQGYAKELGWTHPQLKMESQQSTELAVIPK